MNAIKSIANVINRNHGTGLGLLWKQIGHDTRRSTIFFSLYLKMMICKNTLIRVTTKQNNNNAEGTIVCSFEANVFMCVKCILYVIGARFFRYYFFSFFFLVHLQLQNKRANETKSLE